MKRRHAFAVLGILAVAVAAGLWWGHHERATTSSPDVSPEASAPPDVSPGGTSGWELGTRRMYRFDYTASGEYALAGDADNTGRLGMSVGGTISATVVDVAGDRRKVELTVTPSALDLQAMRLSITPDALRQELARPFIVTYDREGAAVGVSFPTAVARQASTLLRELVSLLQVTVRRHSAWLAVEAEPGGDCEVSLERLADGRIAKKKLRFVRVERNGALVAAEQAVAVPAFERSTARYRVDRGGRVLDAEAEHVTVAKIDFVAGSVRSHVRAVFAHLSTDRPALARSGAGAGPARGSLPARPLTDIPSDRQTAPAPGAEAPRPVAELLTTLRRADEGGDPGALHAAQQELTAAVARDPAALAALMAGKELTQPALSAVGAAGTPEAQAALLKLAADTKRPLAERQQALDAFHEVRDASDDSISKLMQIAEDDPALRENALLAAGGLANRKRDSDPTSSTTWTETLVEAYGAARTTAERIQALDAIGNSGNAAGFDTLVAALSDADQTVRIAAVTNLRLMPAPRADQVLAGLLGGGTDPGLREAALFAIGFRQFGPLAPALESLLQSDPSAEIRMLALNTVVNFLRRDGAQAAEPLIRWSAEHDPDESVRRQAKTALGG
jgi:hypothetical protein